MKNQAWEEDFTKVLQESFNHHKELNKRYSLRAFAQKLGVSSGTLSDILNEKKNWNLTPPRAAALLKKLDLKAPVQNALLVKMGLMPVHSEKELSIDDHAVLTDWCYQPILCSFSLAENRKQPQEIAKHLGISEAKVKAVIKDALERGFLITNAQGEIERPEEFLKSSDGIPSEAIRKYHAHNIETAKKSLTEHPAKLRDFTSLTFVGDKTKIDSLREEIRKVYAKASSLMNGDSENAEVYRLSVQLFPMDFEEK